MDIVMDDSYRSTFVHVIEEVAEARSVRVTGISPFRRLRGARRNAEEQRLRIDFSIAAANREEADRISTGIQNTSKASWTAQIDSAMMKRNTTYIMSILEVSATVVEMSATTATASHDDAGLSQAMLLVIVIAPIFVLVSVAIAFFLCRRSAMSQKKGNEGN
jgi:hypothetical protein